MPTTDRSAREGWQQVVPDLDTVATYAEIPVDPLQPGRTLGRDHIFSGRLPAVSRVANCR